MLLPPPPKEHRLAWAPRKRGGFAERCRTGLASLWRRESRPPARLAPCRSIARGQQPVGNRPTCLKAPWRSLQQHRHRVFQGHGFRSARLSEVRRPMCHQGSLRRLLTRLRLPPNRFAVQESDRWGQICCKVRGPEHRSAPAAFLQSWLSGGAGKKRFPAP